MANVQLLMILGLNLKTFCFPEVMGETNGRKIGMLRCRGLKPPVIRGYAAAFNYWFSAFGFLLLMARNGIFQREIP